MDFEEWKTKYSQVGEWNGFVRYDFKHRERACIVVEPFEHADCGGCGFWVWRTEFFGAFPQVDLVLLEKGYHVAYCDFTNMYGCPQIMSPMKEFHTFVTARFRLCRKAAVFGFSRGGLYAFNYGVAYPEDIGVIYFDAPVLDLRSWPKGEWSGSGSAPDWEACKKLYGICDDDICDDGVCEDAKTSNQGQVRANEFHGSPLDNWRKLFDTDIPVIMVAGGADTLVPYHENGGVLAGKFSEAGREIKVILKETCGHHPHSVEDPAEAAAFIDEACRHGLQDEACRQGL